MSRLSKAVKAIFRDKLLCISLLAISGLVFASLVATSSPWYVWAGLLLYYPVFILFTAWLDAGDNKWLYPGIKDDKEDS